MIGQTFLPEAEQAIRRRLNVGGPQEALQVLSLRLPEVLSGQPMAAADLMKPRMGGVPEGLTELFRLLSGVLGERGAGGGAPSPVFEPVAPSPLPKPFPGPLPPMPSPPGGAPDPTFRVPLEYPGTTGGPRAGDRGRRRW